MSYTISTYTSIEEDGDSVGGGTITSPVVLTITPNPGYVVSASDFIASYGSNPNVDNVVFSNTTSPGVLGNTVQASVTLNNSVAISSADVIISVDINGSAVLWQDGFDDGSTDDVDGANSATIDVVVDLDAVNTNTTVSITSLNGSSVSGNGVVTKTGIVSGTSIAIARIVVSANSSHKITEAAYLDFDTCPTHLNADLLFELNPITSTIDSQGNLTSQTFDLVFTGNRTYTAGDAMIINVEAKAEAIQVLPNTIVRVDFGSDVITGKGEIRTITVYGRSDATFDLDIKNVASNTTIPDFAPLSSKTIDAEKGLPYRFSKHSFDVKFPAGSGETYDLTISGSGSTTLGSNVNSSNLIEQYGDIGISFTHTSSNSLTIDSLTPSYHANAADYTATALAYFENITPTYFGRKVPVEVTFSKPSGTFTKIKDPVFANDWSPVVGTQGAGGNVIDIEDATTTINSPANTFTVKYTVVFYQWGTSDVTFDLDLDNLVTYTA